MNGNIDRREFVAMSLAGAAGLAATSLGQPADKHEADAPATSVTIDRAIAYLKSVQDPATGGWCVTPQAPTFPAITAMAVSGMIGGGAMKKDDPAIKSAVKFILDRQQPDGGIYDKLLPSYNTAISVAGLALVNDLPGVADARKKAIAFLRTLQFGETAVEYTGMPDSAKTVAKDHPFYGGIGYGRHGRPDLSNTAFFVEALHSAGVDANDPAMQRALVFLQRVQMLEKAGDLTVNSMPYAKGSRQGGFIYSTSVDKDQVGIGQSYAPNLDETLSDGTVASRLRSYGSMSYSGFKSYLYAGLKKDDPRVVAAMDWISKNYTLDENPGVGNDGLYYYYLVFAKALSAFGEATVGAVQPDGTVVRRDWKKDLARKLAGLQQADGSFKSVDKRWMEDNAVLITVYSLDALGRTL
jgi:squalene-hopene/tetraprenyl-beta-curcumene cyclase